MEEKYLVKIRFNTHYKPNDGSKEWRVLVNDFENFCNHISINCPALTTKDFIEGVGDKWHISCSPQKIEYIKDDSLKEAPAHYFKEIILR
ncbi:MAG: hypothetical protein JST67_06820 [Bacteroidetes bacterium]|nr:hypothetical protein [Bacteroidota bacterium]